MHATLKVIPTVDANRTPTLNEAAISQTQLVRFLPDRDGLGLVQKMGGWTRYFPTALPAVPRGLWAWRDNEADDYLAVGCQTSVSNPSLGGPLVVINNSTAKTITPQILTENTAVDATTAVGSAVVTLGDPGFTGATLTATGDGTTATITYSGSFIFPVGTSVTVAGVTPSGFNGTHVVTASAANSVSFNNATTGPQTVAGTVSTNGSNITNYDSVYIPAHISVGGLILFGLYQCTAATSTEFQITAVDTLGDPKAATSTVLNGGTVAVFTSTIGSSLISVALPNHGYQVGSTYPCLISTTVGGVTLGGDYTVVAVGTPDQFSIQAASNATASATVSINGGNARYVYYISYGPLASGRGYSTGGYSTEGYSTGTGTTTAAGGFPQDALDWSLDNWGEILIANPDGVTQVSFDNEPSGGPIYFWAPSQNLQIASIIPTAPIANHSMFLAMPQRQIIALGSTLNGIQDHLLIRWCDINNFYQWIARPNNQAGSYRLPKGSRIVGGLQAPQQGLVWTDLAMWAMQYVGGDEVYLFNEIAVGCGLIGKKAMGILNGVTYWMGPTQFYSYANGGVQPMPCTVWDVVFQEIDRNYLDRIRCAPNSRFNEIMWFVPTTGSGGEPTMYVKFSPITGGWDYGSLTRTSWINQSVLGGPIGTDNTGLIFQHETSQNADGQPMTSSFQTGYFTLQDGDLMSFVDQVWPDFKWGYYAGTQNATLLMTFYVCDYPGQTPRVHGPYTLTQATQYITPRLRGRLVSIKVESNDINSFWRIGAPRYRIAADGKF